MRTGGTMWLHKQSVTDIVAVAFKPQYLACAHIKKTGDKIPYSMVSFKQIALDDLELEKQIVFNPTKIGKLLHSLLHEQSLCNADIRLCLSGPAVFEALTCCTDQSIEQIFGTKLKNLIWEDLAIFQNSQLQPITYVCGISRELLFQYQLLAIKHKLNFTCITTSNAALLSSCHALSKDITNQDCTSIHDIGSLIPIQLIGRLCTHIPPTDNPLLMAELIGLCLSELTYENN